MIQIKEPTKNIIQIAVFDNSNGELIDAWDTDNPFWEYIIRCIGEKYLDNKKYKILIHFIPFRDLSWQKVQH